MPKCQFLFSAVFGFRNPSKEIFSELDEINAQGPIFTRSFQKTGGLTKWGHEVARHQAARLGLGRAGLSCGALVWPPNLPFRLLKCSNKKLKLGESLSWKETSVEPAPVCKVFRRIDEENTADSFCKVLCTSELEVITIPSRVLPWFYGGCPESINLKMSTACTWIVDLKQQDGNVLMDAGWPEFVKAHDLKVGYLLTFKKIDTKSLQVLIFGYNCCEKVIWCSGYHPSLGQQNESQLY
ncbi:hypothetical protein QYE76_056617 [Lolium multiflorum]|uniref:TF-B3 domain-containing protein n=1 Tax=Lolium multiflorum TaxID=4521 RepID=A0AAD8T206_LOLMU|nr:hypothetical protein QYE76_056617 [Lolium multiflorum]